MASALDIRAPGDRRANRCGVAVAMLLAGPLVAGPRTLTVDAARYAALPLRNITIEVSAGDELWRVVRGALEARGASFLHEAAMERFLRARRIRYTDSITVADAGALRDGEGVDYVLAGSLLRYERGPEPEITLAVRTIEAATGARVQSTVVSMRGDDTKGLLGLGAVESADELALEVIARVLDGFGPGGRPALVPRPEAPRWVEDVFVAEGFDPASITRLAVLPPTNRAKRPDAAGQIVEHIAHQWFRIAGAEVVESSELRAALIRARVRSLEMLDSDLLRVIGRETDARYFCLGSVERYADTVYTDHGIMPEVEVSLRVVDVVEGQIVAAAGVRRRGHDYHKLLGLGNVRSLGALAEKVAGELVAAITR